ncbi:MAG: GNAT family N-acetyltransferase [Polyangiales bacterium]
MPNLPRGRLVTLRPIAQHDLPQLHRWLNDPDVMQYWDGRDHPATFDRVEARFRRSVEGLDRDAVRYMIETIEPGPDGAPLTIGMIQHGRVHLRAKCAQIEILIGEGSHRDRGFGTDAVSTFLGFLFEELRLHRVWLTLRASNIGATKASEKVGFVREGTLREHDWLEGKFQDVAVYAMLACEWEAAKSRASAPPSERA